MTVKDLGEFCKNTLNIGMIQILLHITVSFITGKKIMQSVEIKKKEFVIHRNVKTI
jgi:hypothetical protein